MRLIGDTRPIANMTYMNGGLVETAPSYLVNSGLNSLGTRHSVVTLTNVGNTITVVNTPGPNPDFGASGIVPGDVIIVIDNNGADFQRNVVSVSGNSVTYDGTPVTISGNGATLTFAANVNIVGTEPAAFCFVASGSVEMVGIRFSWPPNPGNVYDFWIGGTGKVWALNLLLDSRNSATHWGFELSFGGQLIGSSADGDITGHISIIGGEILLDSGATCTQYGNWYVMQLPTSTVTNSCFFGGAGTSFANIITMQANGAGVNSALSNSDGAQCFLFGIFRAFNCTNGWLLGQNSTINVPSLVLDTCGVGINTQDANAFLRGSANINNCTTAISANLNGNVALNAPLTINNCTNGIQLISGSNFESNNNITFNSVINRYAIDATSAYLTPANAGTDPSPSNIFTYSTAGTQTMNSAYLRQLLDSAGVVALQFDPSTVVAGTKIYRGKIFTLTAITAGPHTLTLLGGATFLDGTTSKTFTGVGSTMTIQIDSDTKVAILTSTGVV